MQMGIKAMVTGDSKPRSRMVLARVSREAVSSLFGAVGQSSPVLISRAS